MLTTTLREGINLVELYGLELSSKINSLKILIEIVRIFVYKN